MHHYNFHPQPPRKLSKFKFLLTLLGIAFLLVLLLYLNYRHNINTAADSSDTTKLSFMIKKGDSVDVISEKLLESGIIESDFSFNVYVKFNGFDTKILAGRFFLSKSMTIKQIAENITDAKNAEFLITIQEGLQIQDIDQKLVDLGVITKGEFIKAVKDFNGWQYYSFLDQKTLGKLSLPLEGYIYTDTYFLDPTDFKPHKLIYLALDNFEQKTKDLLPQLKKHSVHQIITMASIIENEVFGSDNRKLVSGILLKRFENGWPLGADITLLYGLEDRTITQEDLNSDS